MNVGFIIPDKEFVWDSVHQGIGYVGEYAKKNNCLDDYQVFRTSGASERELSEFLNQGFDVIGFTLTKPSLGEVSSITKTIKENFSSIIVVGGSEVSNQKGNLLRANENIDYAIYGEGEKTFAELLTCLRFDKNVSNIAGLIYKRGGDVYVNRSRKFMRNMDLLPFPDRRKFKYDYEFHSIIGTRGCPFPPSPGQKERWRKCRRLHQGRLSPPCSMSFG